MKNIPHRIEHLNTWSSVGGAVWRAIEGCSLGGSESLGVGFKIYVLTLPPIALLDCAFVWRCDPPLPVLLYVTTTFSHLWTLPLKL